MKASELKEKTVIELQDLLKELKAKILKLRFDLADKKVKDFSLIEKAKRDIARILTAMKQLNQTK